MLSSIKKVIKKQFYKLGIDVARWETSNTDRALTLNLLNVSRANVVIDVGANTGQFAQNLLGYRPDLKIISFEPLSDAYEELKQNASKFPNWIVPKRMALGAKEGEMEINIANNSASSSLLPMDKSHLEAAPESVYIGKEKVAIQRLDTALQNYLSPQDAVYLKIDTQGYEEQVLWGAEKTLRQVVAIQLEGSFRELYNGQTLALSLISKMEKNGFKLYGFANAFRDSKTHELLQADLYFIRQEKS